MSKDLKLIKQDLPFQMEGNNTSKTMTIAELAAMTGVSTRTIQRYAQKAGWTLRLSKSTGGRPTTLLNELQVTAIIEAIKVGQSNQSNATASCRKIETDKSRDFRIAKNMRLIQNAYNEIIADLKTENQELKVENRELKIITDRSSEYATTRRVEIETGRKYAWKPLKDYSIAHDIPIRKVFDENYGEINSYHREAWRVVYGLGL